ncbi:hypothetical protein CH063_11819 [Colletotrichum higginsianum]|uniref:Uncharacterized protein n=1 Tax=Colletotrichum higginsianum (strain IMI 349063) TaxID=759273 RepID=H1VMY1_COLHI|nr:hypothetical protein CH063_11819 [Colletotrichum higginsianum]
MMRPVGGWEKTLASGINFGGEVRGLSPAIWSDVTGGGRGRHRKSEFYLLRTTGFCVNEIYIHNHAASTDEMFTVTAESRCDGWSKAPGKPSKEREGGHGWQLEHQSQLT